ncbi:PREDICTED: putative F-box protein At3g23260 [Camelina sativa]|uniref:F-box protein At3g23260 n=1 Tax=Camelina sativa TaxID=90675 RepID=A0ABM1QZT5_CAMSA|nr:PREDICTED: putative F-box protein At3g23260 [Camelina sativa]
MKQIRCLNPNHRGVSVNGNTYWVTNKRSEGYHKYLLCYMSLPQPFTYVVAALSVIREEQLCLVGYLDYDAELEELHVWGTTSIGEVMSWSKFFTVKTNWSCKQLLFADGMMSFLADEQEKVLVCCNNGNRYKFIYTVAVGETNHIQYVDNRVCVTMSRSYCSILLNYVPSLAQI